MKVAVARRKKFYVVEDFRLLLGKVEAENRRKTRVSFYHWQERDLRTWLVIYSDHLAQLDEYSQGRAYYRVRIAMIRNELRAREAGP